MFWAEIWKISEFLSENFQFLVVKCSVYLNRLVFVMWESLPLSFEDILTDISIFILRWLIWILMEFDRSFFWGRGLNKKGIWLNYYISRSTAFPITKTRPLNPLLYSKTGLYRRIQYFFLILLKNLDCGYSLEPPRWGGSNEYPQSLFWEGIRKISDLFLFGCKIFKIFE